MFYMQTKSKAFQKIVIRIYDRDFTVGIFVVGLKSIFDFVLLLQEIFVNKLSNIKIMGNISFQHRKRAIFDEQSKQRLADLRLSMLERNRRNTLTRKSCIITPNLVRRSPGSTSTGAASRKESPFADRSYTYKPIASQLTGFRQTTSAERTNPHSSEKKAPPTYHELSATTRSSWIHHQRSQHVYYPSPVRTTRPARVPYSQCISPRNNRVSADPTLITRPPSPPPLDKSRSQIIRKVRNFNDFINAVKKELDERQNREKHLRVVMKLENQAFDIKKYRDVFQKEVSRKHSVKSIDIQQDQPNLKVVDIKLDEPESKNRSSTTKISTDQHSQFSQQPSLITKGRSQLELRLRQTVEQLKHISQLLYDQSQPQKGLNISKNIANIRNIVDGSPQNSVQSPPLQSERVGKIKECLSHMEYLDAVQNNNLKSARTLLEKYQNDEDSKEVEDD